MRGAAGVLLLALMAVGGPATAAAVCADNRAILTTGGTETVIDVEIADDPATRARGLMGRTSVPERHGMLFIYDQPQLARFWMKDTLIPLDLLFVDAAGVVRHIHPDAQPLDLTTIPGEATGDPAPARLMVLELAGGAAARLGLTPGTTLRHPRIPQETAADPC